MDSNNYKTNPEIKDFPDLDLVVSRFKDTGRLKAKSQKWIYEALAKDWCIGKYVLDVGCGIGWGTNMLARESIGAYGIDVNPQSVEFARQMFGGPRVKFDTVDITDGEETPRPVGTFDIVAMIEVIEHIEDYDKALRFIKKNFWDAKRNSIFFITSPNRNNPKIKDDGPKNKHHVREWTAGELYEVLTKHFEHVVLYEADKPDFFVRNHTCDGNSTATPILAKCETPKMEA